MSIHYIYIYIYMYTHVCIEYTRSPSQDFRLFGARPWKVLAATNEKKTISERPRPWRKSCERESCYGDRVYRPQELTAGNADDFVKTNVDAGKTVSRTKNKKREKKMYDRTKHTNYNVAKEIRILYVGRRSRERRHGHLSYTRSP